jgi:hypothetical protein
MLVGVRSATNQSQIRTKTKLKLHEEHPNYEAMEIPKKL